MRIGLLIVFSLAEGLGPKYKRNSTEFLVAFRVLGIPRNMSCRMVQLFYFFKRTTIPRCLAGSRMSSEKLGLVQKHTTVVTRRPPGRGVTF